MRKSLSVLLTLSLAAAGVSLLAMAGASGTLSREANRSPTLYALGALFLALLALGALFPTFARSDYRKVLRAILLLLALGMFLIYVFLGFMWMIVAAPVVSVLTALFLSLYGLAVIMAGIFNYFAAQEGYRPYIYSMAREFPYIYYRYRI